MGVSVSKCSRSQKKDKRFMELKLGLENGSLENPGNAVLEILEKLKTHTQAKNFLIEVTENLAKKPKPVAMPEPEITSENYLKIIRKFQNGQSFPQSNDGKMLEKKIEEIKFDTGYDLKTGTAQFHLYKLKIWWPYSSSSSLSAKASEIQEVLNKDLSSLDCLKQGNYSIKSISISKVIVIKITKLRAVLVLLIPRQ